MARTLLTPVIKIDEKKCINCYACIVICPVKYCMDGSGEKLQINADLCIGCGNCCINACTHKVRTLIDDADRFMNDLKHNKKIIMGDYNVTMIALKNLLDAQNTNLSSFAPVKYTGISAERAVEFLIPGGLLDTAALDSSQSQSNMVKTDYADILSMTEKLREAMYNLSALSGK